MIKNSCAGIFVKDTVTSSLINGVAYDVRIS